MSEDGIPDFLVHDRSLATKKAGAVSVFRPEEAAKNDAKADALIDYAKRVKDWPTLEVAIDKKLEDQTEFVGWWDKTLTPNKGGDRVSKNQKLRPALLVEDAEDVTSISHQQVSKWRRRLKDAVKYREMLFGTAYHKAMAETNNTTAAKWTGDPESYTPEKYIEAARAALGGIDLDPASNALAQNIVKAEEWYDEEENGLLQDWSGRVFLNPPYAYPAVANFIQKLCDEYEAGDVTAAVLLTNNNTDTKWWHMAASVASAVCFTAGRINFYKADGTITQPTNGQTFFYFGADPAAFHREFSEIGLIMSWWVDV